MRRSIIVAVCTGVGCGVMPTPASGQDLLVSWESIMGELVNARTDK